MKRISTYMHGMFDYAMGILLILLPFWIGLDPSGPELKVMMYMGIGIIIYNLITDYEIGLARMIPMPAHITLDVLSGLFLAASPWIFGFSNVVYIPHLLLGIVEICVAVITDSHPIRVH